MGIMKDLTQDISYGVGFSSYSIGPELKCFTYSFVGSRLIGVECPYQVVEQLNRMHLCHKAAQEVVVPSNNGEQNE